MNTTSWTGKKWQGALLVICVVALAIFFRFYDLGNTPPGLYPDEAMNGNNALHALRTHTFSWFYPDNNGREGLFINIQALLLYIFNTRESWVLRSAAGAFGVLTVLGTFMLGKKLFGMPVGLFASFLTATGVWAIHLSRLGFRANMAPCFAAWSLYFLLEALDNPNVKKKGALILSALSGLMLGLGMHSYIAFRVMPGLVVLVFVWFFIFEKENRKALVAKFALVVLSALIAFAPLGYYFIQNPGSFFGRTSQVSVFSSQTPLKDLVGNIGKTALMFFTVGDGNWRHNFAGRAQLAEIVAFFFGCGIIAGLLAILLPGRQKNRKEIFGYLFLGFWVALTALPVVISDEGIPHSLRAILMIPAVYIICAAGAAALYDATTRRFGIALPQIITLCALIALPAHTYYWYFTRWAHDPNVPRAFAADYVKIGQNLLARPATEQKYVLVEAGGVLVNGVPMPAQTVMFITDTFDRQQQDEKNIHYVLPQEKNSIPPGSYVVTIR